MTARPGPGNDLPRAGLCNSCRYAEILRSPRSVFLRCGRAADDPRYPRYPGLPVVACDGWAEGEPREPAKRAPGGDPRS
jgi:hypothetical protein